MGHAALAGSEEHREFDELCQDVDEFEPLPDQITVRRNDQDTESGTLDPLILAGLVTPV